MKKIIYIIFPFLLCGCFFSMEPPRTFFYIINDSEEAIYVYLKFGESDSLPLSPKLELFHFFNNKGLTDSFGNPLPPGFGSPEYRINAYARGSLQMFGSRNPRLPPGEKEITLFFIPEKTMRDYEWEDIYKEQMYVKRVTLTKEQLERIHWQYTYEP